MPQKRAKNMLNKWYANLVNRILPPLPEDEWLSLKRLASGTQPFALVPRRPRAEGKLRHISSLDLGHFLMKDIRKTKQSTPWTVSYTEEVTGLTDEILRSELQQEGLTLPLRRNNRDSPHQLTQRSLRRMYAKIFRHCCRMESDGKGRDQVTWGSQVIDAKQPCTRLDSLFSLVTYGPGRKSNENNLH